MAAPMGHLTIKFNSIKFNSLGLLLILHLDYTVTQFKIEIGVLQREKLNKNTQIWAKSDIQFLRNWCLKILCILLFCHYIDEVNEENWQNMLMNINLYQYFTSILWINLHTIFILQNFSLKLGLCVPMA